ncbi:hypothetical protein FACS1894204_02120 [Synergistales bacterium]|nr:hypothetical protein FACS1894204_02120 [Synergistales bacterium]
MESNTVQEDIDGVSNFRRIFSQDTPDGVMEIDFKSGRIYCSDFLLQLFCLTDEAMPHTIEQWLELYHPDDYAKSLEFLDFLNVNASFPQDGPQKIRKFLSLERRLYCGDGLYRWFRLDVLCFSDRLVGVETNISQRKNAEEEKEARMADITKRLSDAQRKSIFLEEQITSLSDKIAALDAEKAELSARLSEEEKKRLSGEARAEAEKNLRLAGERERTEENVRKASEEAMRMAEDNAIREEMSKSIEALSQNGRLLKKMLDAASDMLFYRDEHGRVTLYNAPFANALALNPNLAGWTADCSDANNERLIFDAHGRPRSIRARLYPVSESEYVGAVSDISESIELDDENARLRMFLGRRVARRGLEIESDPVPESAPPSSSSPPIANESENLSAAVAVMRDAQKALSPVAELFATRAKQIESFIGHADNAELEVGVIGITSSGKSTLINALMGERLLPEETRATTNLAIRCRKGSERSVTVTMKDGTQYNRAGSELTLSWMESLSSERLNPANEKNVALLEWSSPGAALPEGLNLVDTPGLDALGFPEHSELVLRQILPTLDIALYMTSIRNRMKTTDIEVLNSITEQNQRVVFLLSQIDLERDDTEGGRVIFSRTQKLSAYIREIFEDIKRVKGNISEEPTVIPISSKLAEAHFYDRTSPEWSASNFGLLIKQLEDLKESLYARRNEVRAARAVVILTRTASDVKTAIYNSIQGNSPQEDTGENGRSDSPGRLDELRDASRWVSAEVSAVRNEWRELLEMDTHMKNLALDLAAANTVKGVKDRYERWSAELFALTARMTARMDRAVSSCRDILSQRSITPGEPPDLPQSPNSSQTRSVVPFHRYVQHRARERQVRGWFESAQFWPQYQMFFKQDVDRDSLLASAKEILAERLRVLNSHLSWWEKNMRENFCEPLYEELAREEAALSDITAAAQALEAKKKDALDQALAGVRRAEREIKNILPRDLENKSGATPLGSEIDLGHGLNMDEDRKDAVLMTPILAVFREQEIQSRFLSLDSLKSLKKSKRVVLLGLRRHDSLRLLSRLAHDATFFNSDSLNDAQNERDWLFCGATPPALPHVRVEAPDTLLREMEVLIAPGDALCSDAVDWNDLFAEWLPVIHLDIARIDSGLSDLARAPYAKAISNAFSWVAVSGHGALFDSRLADLLTDVPDRLDMFALRRDCKSRPEWFVYENYDARYTDFMLWGRGIPENEDDFFIKKWQASGHSFEFPFSEFRMRLALSGARHKRSL